MDTPIYDFVKKYAQEKALRAHMPGHKGNGPLGVEALDITEIEGADVLYSPGGVIKKSEENASALFGSARTLYSTEGSSLSIRAMLYLAALYAKSCGKSPRIAAGRNAHRVFISGAALLDLDVVWIFPKKSESIISCEIAPDALDRFLGENEVCAVYITSPDYLGNIADIAGLSRVCKKHGVLLLVDNAHGAYLNFLPSPCHPIALGADVTADSAHKTLPVLTGGGYLHISKDAPRIFFEQADSAMALFASTSPSYLIMQSLDLANGYIADSYRERLSVFAEKTEKLKKDLTEAGYILVGSEPLKVTLAPKSYGYTGIEIAEILRKNNIICEFCDRDFTVLMLTPENSDKILDEIREVLVGLPKNPEITDKMPTLDLPESVLSPREATMLPSREFDVCDCVGRVLATPSVSCPPAIPIVVCGEKISESAVRVFEYYGIKKVRCVETKQ